MSRILDIDMDFFLNKIAAERNGDERLDESEYIPWSEKEFRLFLEKKCKLNKDTKILGRIIKNHDEAFQFWEELIITNSIKIPLQITHIDAHTDLNAGHPSMGLPYILGDLLHLPLHKRLNNLDKTKVGSANYLAFAIACGFFNEVNLVIHPDFENANLPTPFFKDLDVNSNKLEMKAYSKKTLLYSNFNSPVSRDPEIPFQIIQSKKFQSKNQFDYLVFCQSPGYTPKTADFMMEVIKDYIEEI